MVLLLPAIGRTRTLLLDAYGHAVSSILTHIATGFLTRCCIRAK